jgi:hypothetical protein
MMSRTVIGIFDDKASADEALTALSHNGFNDEQVDCSSARVPSMSAESRNESRENADNAVIHFFRSLFGNDEHADKYTRAAKGRSIITVHAADDESANEAAEIMDDCGAIDVDDKRGSVEVEGNQMRDMSIDSRTDVDMSEKRLRSCIIERPVESQYRLREQRMQDEQEQLNPNNELDNSF